MRVEFIYDNDCPNAPAAREALAEALSQCGFPSEWIEWDRSDPEAPAHARVWGSPTILVEGRDVGDAGVAQGKACRVYVDQDGSIRGIPSVAMISAAIQAGADTTPHAGKSRGGRSRTLFAALPATSLAFVPGITCAGCWPAYAALASPLGIGLFNYTPFLLPAMGILVVVAVGSMSWDSRRKQSYGPLLLGIIAGAGVLVFKFAFPHDVALYSSAALLVGASIWNMRNAVAAETPGCPA